MRNLAEHDSSVSLQAHADLQARIASMSKDGLARLKVSVVSSTFQPQRSYQENLWAEQLADLGAAVTVFSAIELGITRQITEEILTSPLGSSFLHKSVPTHVLPQNQFLSPLLADALVASEAELIVWFGCIMYFGGAIYSDSRLAKTPLITIYSLSRRGRHPFRWYGRHLTLGDRLKGLLFQTVRAPILTQTLRRADLTVANTPECTDIIRQYVWGDERIKWARKHEEIPLGFCGHTFTYHSALRQSARAALPLSEQDLVLVFSSRFEENKWPAIYSAFNAVERFFDALGYADQARVHAIWVGAKDNDTTRKFNDLLLEPSRHRSQHHLMSFQTRQRLATIYHAADIALFAQPSISCQEAMGTGLYVLCPPDPSLNHLNEYSSRLRQAETSTWPEQLISLSRVLWREQEDKGLGVDPTEDSRQLAAMSALELSYQQLVPRTLIALSQKLG